MIVRQINSSMSSKLCIKLENLKGSQPDVFVIFFRKKKESD